MKFIQTSDIHIGESRSLDNYLTRHEKILYQILYLAEERQLPLIIPGDIFHDKKTTDEEELLFYRWLGDIEERQIPTIITTGNHDHLGKSLWGELTQLTKATHMPYKYIKIIDWEPNVTSIGDIGFICIPWNKVSEKEFKSIVESKLPLIADKKYKVVMAHECICGVKLDNGMIMPKGTALPQIPQITYWAIGDIHKHQRANLANSWYAGAPAQWNFGDQLPKGVIVVDLENPSGEPEFVNIKSKPLKTVSSVKEIQEDAYYKVIGNYKEVIEANLNEMVVKSQLSEADDQILTYDKTGIVDGLPEFLAEKGIDAEGQTKAVTWVSETLNLQGGLI